MNIADNTLINFNTDGEQQAIAFNSDAIAFASQLLDSHAAVGMETIFNVIANRQYGVTPSNYANFRLPRNLPYETLIENEAAIYANLGITTGPNSATFTVRYRYGVTVLFPDDCMRYRISSYSRKLEFVVRKWCSLLKRVVVSMVPLPTPA